MKKLCKYFLRRCLPEASILAILLASCPIFLFKTLGPLELGLAQAIALCAALGATWRDVPPLGPAEWALPVKRKELFDAAASTSLLFSQLVSLLPTVVVVCGGRCGPVEGALRWAALHTLAAVVQVLESAVSPLLCAATNPCRRVARVGLWGLLAGGSLGLAFATPALNGMLIAAFFLAIPQVWSLGRRVHRWHELAGLAELREVPPGKPLRDATGTTFHSRFFRGFLEPLGAIVPPRWKYLALCITGPVICSREAFLAVLAPVTLSFGSSQIALISVLGGASTVQLIRLRLPWLWAFSRDSLYAAATLPLFLLSGAGGCLSYLLLAESHEPRAGWIALVHCLAVHCGFTLGVAIELPPRCAKRQRAHFAVGMLVRCAVLAVMVVDLSLAVWASGGSNLHASALGMALRSLVSAHTLGLGTTLFLVAIFLHGRNSRACRWLEWRR